MKDRRIEKVMARSVCVRACVCCVCVLCVCVCVCMCVCVCVKIRSKEPWRDFYECSVEILSLDHLII